MKVKKTKIKNKFKLQFLKNYNNKICYKIIKKIIKIYLYQNNQSKAKITKIKKLFKKNLDPKV